MKYLLDTNICIYIIRRKPIKIFHKFIKNSISDIGISSITLAELEYGIEKSSSPFKNRIALSEFLSPIEILQFDDSASKHYGIIRADLERRSKTIGFLDIQIAAHAISLDVTLITNNIKEFKRIKNLKLENWI